MSEFINNSADLELIDEMPRHTFRWNSHGYPCDLTKWHYHPEYEIHLIESTTGKMFVGDYIGSFVPGNLVLTGPNLPHNWVSDIASEEYVPDRDMVVQFGEHFIKQCIETLPEVGELQDLLAEAPLGVEFFGDTIGQAQSYLRHLGKTTGMERLIVFMQLLHLLANTHEKRTLSTGNFVSPLNRKATAVIDRVMKHMLKTSSGSVRLADVAAIANMSETAFSRFFHKHTGHTFVQYLTRLRISRACDQLTYTSNGVTEICYDVGFNNISNFNRQFARVKGVTPSAYRRQAMRNLTCHDGAQKSSA